MEKESDIYWRSMPARRDPSLMEDDRGVQAKIRDTID
jgi:hypothetical protein